MRQIRKQVLTGTESNKDAQILPIRDSNRQGKCLKTFGSNFRCTLRDIVKTIGISLLQV